MRYVLCLLAILLLATGCHRAPHEPLTQRGYLWQRNWTPAVSEGVVTAGKSLDGIVLLGAEMRFIDGKPSIVRANIDWSAAKRAGKPLSIALRIAPFSGPVFTDPRVIQSIATEAKSLLADAAKNGAQITEFQLDFDCAQSRLAEYRRWLAPIRESVKPARFVITTLPAWLDETAMRALVNEADGFVLQVHSVPAKDPTGRAVLCDTVLAQKWIEKAAKLGKPFAVALPTYRCLAGYGTDGKLLGLAMDAERPSWPAGTRTLELAADADDLAKLVAALKKERPQNLRAIIWYRVPVASDKRNWSWPTLDAVMQGRAPTHKLRVDFTKENTSDFTICNDGESDEPLACSVTIHSLGATPLAGDALAGWSLKIEAGRATFTTREDARLRLPPGEKRPIGWLRYESPPALQVDVAEHERGAR